MKKKYIKPETELVAINEAMSLLQNSITGDLEEEDEEGIRVQSKEHDSFDDFGYDTWEEWDNGGSSLWD